MMRYDKNYAVFIDHSDWYTVVKGVGYVPTDKAPPEAVVAMEKFNSHMRAMEKIKGTPR